MRADGSLPRELADVAKGHWEAEDMPLRGGDGPRLDLASARWEPDAEAERSLRRLGERTRQG